jgi:hypothetical protein
MMLREESVPLDPANDAETPDASRPAFNFVSSSELMKPLPPRVHLVESILPEGSIVVVGGYGSSAKTWFTTSLAISIARGIPWLERFQTTKARPAIFDYENGDYESRRRIHALNAGLGATSAPDVALCVHPAYTLNSRELAPALEDVLAEHRVAVFDSLRAATPGIDENDSSIRQHIDDLRRIPGFDKSCIVLLAHARKGGSGDPREHLRGSGAIFDAADQVFFLKAEEDTSFAVQQTKSRFGPKTDPFGFWLEDVSGGGVRLVEHVSQRRETKDVDPKLIKAVRSAVERTPGITSTGLRKSVTGRSVRIDAAVAFLQETGVIKRVGRGRYCPVSNQQGSGHE